jgi:hypothetical protein
MEAHRLISAQPRWCRISTSGAFEPRPDPDSSEFKGFVIDTTFVVVTNASQQPIYDRTARTRAAPKRPPMRRGTRHPLRRGLTATRPPTG